MGAQVARLLNEPSGRVVMVPMTRSSPSFSSKREMCLPPVVFQIFP